MRSGVSSSLSVDDEEDSFEGRGLNTHITSRVSDPPAMLTIHPQVVWCHERSYKKDREGMRLAIERAAAQVGHGLICFKKAYTYSGWLAQPEVPSHILVADNRELRPCLAVLNQVEAERQPRLMLALVPEEHYCAKVLKFVKKQGSQRIVVVQSTDVLAAVLQSFISNHQIPLAFTEGTEWPVWCSDQSKASEGLSALSSSSSALPSGSFPASSSTHPLMVTDEEVLGRGSASSHGYPHPHPHPPHLVSALHETGFIVRNDSALRATSAASSSWGETARASRGEPDVLREAQPSSSSFSLNFDMRPSNEGNDQSVAPLADTIQATRRQDLPFVLHRRLSWEPSVASAVSEAFPVQTAAEVEELLRHAEPNEYTE